MPAGSRSPKEEAQGGIRLQRLFSTFPGGWPGIGLLLLRIALAVTIVADGIAYLANWHERSFVTCLAVFLAVASSALVVIGLITPVASIMVALSTIAAVLSSLPEPTGTLFDTKPLVVDVIVMAIALALLGPGAFSLDARLFGRREIIIPNTSPSSKF